MLVGTGGRDVLSGRGGHDCLFGRSADDRISGGTGADLVDGDTGSDRLSGNAGQDKIRGENGNDKAKVDRSDIVKNREYVTRSDRTSRVAVLEGRVATNRAPRGEGSDCDSWHVACPVNG